MKRILQIAALAIVIVVGSSLRNKAAAQTYGEVSYQTFYDELSPYGRWVDNQEYGYVWVPDAGPDFRPYSTDGHWVWTDDYEWMWVSDYDWGWAPFHYGRWTMDPYYGWIWVPGYEWSPAWVAWRSGGDYYGWAPLRPGISISINFRIGSYNPPYDYWCFAPRRYITSPRIYDYYYDRGQNITIINNTTIINNYNYDRNVYRTGPSRYEAERYTGRISPVRFREASSPGRTRFRNNEVSVYRPAVQRDESRRYAPRTFERANGGGNIDRQRSGNNDNVRINGRTERPSDSRRFENENRSNGNNLPTRERTAPFERRNTDADSRSNGNNLPTRERSINTDPRGQNRNDNTIDRRNNGFERRNGNGNGQVRERQIESAPQQRQYERPAPVDRGNGGQVREQREFRTQGNGRGQQMERPAPQEQRQYQQERPQPQQQRQVQQERPQPQQQRQMQQERPQPQQQRGEPREERTQNGNGGGNGNGQGRGKRF